MVDKIVFIDELLSETLSRCRSQSGGARTTPAAKCVDEL